MIEVILNCLFAFVDVLSVCMLARAVLSWFPMNPDGFIPRFLYIVTEPAIMPMRALFNRLNLFQDLPIDISFFATYLFLSLIGTFASVL